jgi:ABC-2 type transport system ATP-binding protein
MHDAGISVRDLRKAYGGVPAVDNISIEVARGEIFGLLGPNGAGKTTTLESLEGIRKPDSGMLRILGADPIREPDRLRDLIGVQLQNSALPAEMTPAEAMRFFCAYHGVAANHALLDRLGLAEKRTSRYQALSVGQQRRLALALALGHKPPVVILDEPTAGLDVGSRTELHALMQELREEGTTILLATHDMAEAEKLADRVAILLAGKVVATGTPRELTATGSGYTKVSVRTEENLLQAPSGGASFPAVAKRLVSEDYIVFFSTDPGPTVAAILDRIAEGGDRLIDLRVERPSLEERFLELTNARGAR